MTPTTPPTGEIYDSTLKAAYTFSGGIFKSYNNLATVQAKVDYVNANGLGGIIIWELGQGYFSGGSPANPLLEPFAGQLTDNPAGTSLNHRNASGNYNERIVTNIDAATVTLDMSLGGQHLVTIAGNRTIAVTNVSVGKIFTLRVKQDATGSRTLTWFSGITWAGGTPPTLTTTANKADRLGFVCTGV